jgi:DNA-binding transcriptional LysR family regulator
MRDLATQSCLRKPDSLTIVEAFQAQGLAMPKIALVALSGLLRMNLLSRGPFVTAVPRSLLTFNAARLALKILPVDLHIRGYPVAVLTLKNRVLSPLVALFIEQVRDVANSTATSP